MGTPEDFVNWQIATVFLVAIASGCTATGSFTDTPMNTSGTVVEATDGDTLSISINGTVKDVRLIGVDAPETFGDVNPSEFDVEDTEQGRKCLSEYALIAKKEAEELETRQVSVYQDSVQNLTGSYNRKLAYIYSGSQESFNEYLLRKGYARVYVTEFAEADRFMEIQREAREEERGLWGC